MKSFEEYFVMEEKLTTKDRDKLSDDDYGIIIKDKDGNVTERAYPLNDAKHVEAAARMYPFAKRKYDREIVAELRRKIIAKAKEYNVPDSKIQSVIDDEPGGKSKHVKESVGPLDDDTTGTSEFDESSDNDPDDCYAESFIVESKNYSIHMRPATKADLDRMYRWEMESIDKKLQKDPKVQKLIREDVEQSIKDTQMIMDGRITIGMFTACMIDDGEWRYIGEIYLIPSYRGRGIGSSILRKEIEQYPKIRLQVATSNDKAIKLYKSLGFKIVKENKKQKMYLMEYTQDTVQEGVIQNIKNKVSPFEKNLVYHISPEGHLDGQIFKPRVPDYLDKYDPSKTEFEDVETPRVCFSPSIEGCLNAIIVNIGRWKTAEKLRDWYVYIPEKPLKEYKYRTTKQLVDEKKVYDANLTKEIWIEEPVRLKQYGVIRIDSVVDKSRKKAVPTTLGESKKRNVYDFKWHWLVKPKVLKDVPYDYSPLEVCKDMVADLESYKYGIPENGRIVNGSEHDYDTKWKLQSPEEFEKNGGGICYDYVEFEEGYLDAYGIKCKKYFISTDLPGHDTHTFILVDDGHGGYIYPESSFKPMEGAHEVKSLDHACSMVADGFWKINDNLKKVKPTKQPNMNKEARTFKCYLWEYTGHPPYGSNMATCTKYYSKGEPIKEWTQVEPNFGEPKSDKAKALQEFVTSYRNDHYMDYDELDESLFEEHVLSDVDIYEELYQEYDIYQEATKDKPSLGRRIWNSIISILKWIRQAVSKLIKKIKSFIARVFKKKNINDVARKVLGDETIQEAYITSDQMVGKKQKRQSPDYMDRHGMTGGKLAQDLYVEVVDSDTIKLHRGMDNNEWHQNTKNIKFDKRTSKHSTDMNGPIDSAIALYDFCWKIMHIDEFTKSAHEILEALSTDKPDVSRIDKTITDFITPHIYETNELKTFTLSMNDLTKYQSMISMLLDKLTEYTDRIGTEVPEQQLKKLRSHLIYRDQFVLNVITKNLVMNADTINPKYRRKIKSFDKLAEFVDTCIKNGIPSKIFMYNTWLACAKELNTKDKYEPLAGQGRFVLFPADKSFVLKIAYNGFGIMSNRNECNITDFIKNSDITQYFALIKRHSNSYSVIEQERVYNDTAECKSLEQAIVKKDDDFATKVMDIMHRFKELQSTESPSKTQLWDIHRGNVFYDTHHMTIRLVDYGWVEKSPNKTNQK